MPRLRYFLFPSFSCLSFHVFGNSFQILRFAFLVNSITKLDTCICETPIMIPYTTLLVSSGDVSYSYYLFFSFTFTLDISSLLLLSLSLSSINIYCLSRYHKSISSINITLTHKLIHLYITQSLKFVTYCPLRQLVEKSFSYSAYVYCVNLI